MCKGNCYHGSAAEDEDEGEFSRDIVLEISIKVSENQEVAKNREDKSRVCSAERCCALNNI